LHRPYRRRKQVESIVFSAYGIDLLSVHLAKGDQARCWLSSWRLDEGQIGSHRNAFVSFLLADQPRAVWAMDWQRLKYPASVSECSRHTFRGPILGQQVQTGCHELIPVF